MRYIVITVIAIVTALAVTGATGLAATPPTPVSTSVPETPPPPPPPSPTPKLPEEGGPAGAVISGFLYNDVDNSGTLTPGDTPIGGDTVIVEQLDAQDRIIQAFSAISDAKGHWEVRALKDGRYRVRWEPSIPPSLIIDTIPARQAVALDPLHTADIVAEVVQVSLAAPRVSVNFGLHSVPVAGSQNKLGLPRTGTGTGKRGFNLSDSIIIGVITIGIGFACAKAAARRHSERS